MALGTKVEVYGGICGEILVQMLVKQNSMFYTIYFKPAPLRIAQLVKLTPGACI
jgi:hypothetical protein